jgi:polysaccharide pyruvyl transferase WcaK-like protein
VVSGGGQLDDFWGGAWNHPWSMFLWTALARMRGVKVVYLGVGVDGLRQPLSRVFCSFAMRWANQRSFRDTASLQTMRDMGMRAPSDVCPDLAFALKTEELVTNDGVESGQTPFVVISPIAQKTWTEQPTQQHQNYMSALMNLGIEIAGKGYSIRLACSQTEMDKDEAQQLLQHLSAAGVPEVALCDIRTVGDFIAQVRGADLVIASRLHGVILSLIAGCPVIAIAHLGKVTEVMKEFSLEDYCINLQALDETFLRTRVLDALNHRDGLRQIATKRVDQNAKRLEGVFGSLST